MAVCTDPQFITSFGFIACGKCPNCLRNKRKEWSDRLIIESKYHMFNYFVTLTYAPEFLPIDESVHKETVRKYLKRLRYYCCGYLPRHFGCGEYGDESARPHYHLCVFADKDIFKELMQAWEFGRIEVDALTPGRCCYCSGYVLKKMTKADDPRLLGRKPEFWFGSRKPGLGYDLLYEILDKIASDPQFLQHVLTHAYVPSSLRLGGKSVRLPRYIRDKLKPIWRYYNEEKQVAARQKKKAIDIEILKALCESLSGVSPIECKNFKQWSFFSMQQRAERQAREEKARNLKTKRKIL